MTGIRAMTLASLAVLAACNAAPPAAQPPPPAAPAPAAAQPAPAPTSTEVRVAHQPPTAKDVIDAVIASGSVPLSVSPTCANVGTEPSDATIGRYLAGFLAELSSPSKKNWIETTVEPGRSPTGEAVSICTLTLRHEDGDDRWGWGVRFHVRSSDGVVIPSSFVCTGAG
jgi:hypothetical protein